MKNEKVVIVGAGPVGCYAGYLFAKNGYNVSIYEEHKEIGLPIQCTGLLTSDFDKFKLSKKEFLINTFNQVEINSKNNYILTSQKEYLIDRKKFDNYLARKARSHGAKIYLNHSFIGRNKKNKKTKNSVIIKSKVSARTKEISYDIIIGADGPLSKVAKSFNLNNQNNQNYYGIQAIVKGKFEKNKYYTYFSKETCPDLFAWIVPETKTRAKVGLASLKNSRILFNKFLRKNKFENKVKEIQAGTIPLYSENRQIHKNNCYLLGDAAGFVKATTLGGIIPGMDQAKVLVKSIIQNSDYEKNLKKLRKKMRTHLKLRKLINKFSDDDWDKLLSIINKKKIKKIFKENSRENPLPLLIKLGLAEPKLISFLKYLF